LINEISERLQSDDGLSSAIATLQASLQSTNEVVDSNRNRIDGHDGRLGAHDGDIAAMYGRIGNNEANINSLGPML
jgi:hypothetical protein